MTMGLKTTIFCAIVIFVLLSFKICFAFNCKGNFISTGERKSSVMEQCGSPTSVKKQQYLEGAYGEGTFGGRIVEIETWYYDCGSSDFIQILTFRDDILISITSGGQGTPGKYCR